MKLGPLTWTVFIFIGASGCTSPWGSEPAENPYIVGPVETITHRATSSTLLVRAGPGFIDACGIFATVDNQTRYQSRSAGGTQNGSLDDIRIGDTVEVYVTGPVAESCPVQGRADKIVRLADPI